MDICHVYWKYEMANDIFPDFNSFERWMAKLPSTTAMIYKYSFSPLTFEYWFTEEQVQELNEMKLKGNEARGIA